MPDNRNYVVNLLVRNNKEEDKNRQANGVSDSNLFGKLMNMPADGEIIVHRQPNNYKKEEPISLIGYRE